MLAGERSKARPIPSLIIASTLLVPDYVEEEEVRSLARFTATVNPEIPYSLLAFYPHFYMSELPFIQRSIAEKCLQAAREGGGEECEAGQRALASVAGFYPSKFLKLLPFD